MARNPAQRRRIEALIKKLEPTVRDAFLAAMQTATAAIDQAALLAALEGGDVMRAVALFRMDQSTMFPVEDAIRGAYVAGGTAVAADLPKAVAGKFGFNGRHYRAEEWTRRIGSELIAGIQADTLEAARVVITRGLSENTGLRAVARELTGAVNNVTGKRDGGIVGLDGPRLHRLEKVKVGMKTPEGVRDLVMVHRDGSVSVRYKVNKDTENRILEAYRKGEAVPAAQRQIAERQYSNALLKERGKTIAENETFTAQAAGRHEGFRQLSERDDVESVEKTWIHGHSRQPRPDHLALDGETIPFDDLFEMGDGARLMHPHDPAGGAEHSIGCKCTLFYRAIVPKR